MSTCALNSRPSACLLARESLVVAMGVCLAALPLSAARAQTVNTFTSRSDFLSATGGRTNITFEGTAPPGDQADYSDTGLTIGEATFNGESINVEHLTYIFNGKPTVVDSGPDVLTDLLTTDGADAPDQLSVDGTSSLLTAFNETSTTNEAQLGPFTDYHDRFTLQTVFEIDLANPHAAFGFDYRGIEVFNTPLQQYDVQFFQDSTLIGDAGTITGIPDWTPANPLFLGFTSTTFFNRVVITGINPPSPTDPGEFDSSGSLAFDNVVFGQTAAPEPGTAALVTPLSLLVLGRCAARRRRR
jgi:hypothetical protein